MPSNPKLTLRRAGAADAALIADMHSRSRAATYRGLLPDAYLDLAMPAEMQAQWAPKLDQLSAGAGAALIAELDDEAIGFVCVLAPDESGSALIDNLHMLPERKGGGAGTALLDAARSWALEQGARRLHLLVLEANRAAIGFYEARGWQLAERRDDTMGGAAVVALVYVLPLVDTPG